MLGLSGCRNRAGSATTVKASSSSHCASLSLLLTCLAAGLLPGSNAFGAGAGAGDDGWTTVGVVNDAQAVTRNSNDEWHSLGEPVRVEENRIALNRQQDSAVTTLVPTLSALETAASAIATDEPEREAVTPTIVEFGTEGSSANVSDVDIAEKDTLVSSMNLDMFAGELKVLGKVDVTRVAIGDGGMIRAEILKTGELLVIAQQEGSTSLRLWNKDNTQTNYNIRISGEDMETRVRMERMVRMRVRMVEFRKNALGQLGIDWSDFASGPTFAAAGDAIGNNIFRPAAEGFEGLPNRVEPFSTYFGITSSITSKINFLTQNGDALILAEPVLSAMNGGQASFLAGGEVPYPSVSETGQSIVEFKEYGIKLNIAPNIDSAGNVRTFIETEISQLDRAVTVNDAPGLLTRRASTQFNVKSGETIVISGLLSADSSNDANMIPGIGRLPIIGKLFGSENQQNSITELVIFVTPEVVEPGQRIMTANETRRYDDTSAKLRDARQQLPLME